MENEIQSNSSPAQPLTPIPPPVSSTNWSKILVFILLGLMVIVGSVFVGIQIGKNQIVNNQPITEQPLLPPQTADNQPVLPIETNSTNTDDNGKFTGIITETNNGCWSDGVCGIKVDDKWIIAEVGGLQPPNSEPLIRGNSIGINFSQETNKYIGKKVEVYAKKLEPDKTYSIYGDANYYIKILE